MELTVAQQEVLRELSVQPMNQTALTRTLGQEGYPFHLGHTLELHEHMQLIGQQKGVYYLTRLGQKEMGGAKG